MIAITTSNSISVKLLFSLFLSFPFLSFPSATVVFVKFLDNVSNFVTGWRNLSKALNVLN